MKYRLLCSFIFFTLINSLTAQNENITGTWRGNLDKRQFLQLSVIQKGDKICGYTWDSMYASRGDYCKAYFAGVYNKNTNQWLLKGTSFIESSGNHVLMQLRLWTSKVKGKTILRGTSNASVLDTIYLRKISDDPEQILDDMEDCFSEKPHEDSEPDPGRPLLQIDDLKPVISKEEKILTQQMNSRRNKEISRIAIDVKKITLNVYDNATVDGDTVSIFYNGKLIMSHQRISDKPVTVDVALDENASTHKITLFAENLGTIPPNTALVVVNAGGKRYELYSSANLKENGVLVFEYKPK